MSKITFILLFFYCTMGVLKCQLTKKENASSTSYICCGRFASRIVLSPNKTNISAVTCEDNTGHCKKITIPHLMEYNDIEVICLRTIGRSIEINESMTHTFELRTPTPPSTTTPVPTSTPGSTSIPSTISNLISTSPPVTSSTQTPNPLINNGEKITAISAGVIIIMAVTLAVLITTVYCCMRRTKMRGVSLEACQDISGDPIHQNEVTFTTPKEVAEESAERKLSKEELVSPLENGKRMARNSASRIVSLKVSDDLEKLNSPMAVHCCLVEDEEHHLNGLDEANSTPSLDSELQMEEPVHDSADSHQIPASTQEMQTDTRSAAVSLRPPHPPFFRQSSYCPPIDNTAGYVPDFAIDEKVVKKTEKFGVSCTL